MGLGDAAGAVHAPPGAGQLVRADTPDPGPGGPGSTELAALNPLATLRPVGPGAVIDGGFELLRHRLGRLLALSACLFLPIWLLDLVLVVLGPAPATESTGTLVGPAAVLFGSDAAQQSSWTWLVTGLQLVALSVLGLCAGHLVAAMVRGEDPGLGQLGRVAWRRSWVAVLIVPLNLVVHVLTSCLGGIGWLLGDALVFITSVVAGAERLGPWAAWRRSMKLAGAEYGRSLVVVTGAVVISLVISLSLSAGPAALFLALDPGSALVTIVSAAGAAVILLTSPLTACIAARAYVDLRCRHEGWDLELRRQAMELPRT